MLLPIYTRGTTANNTHEFYDYIYYGSDAMQNTLSRNAAYYNKFGVGSDTFFGIYNKKGELIRNNSDR